MLGFLRQPNLPRCLLERRPGCAGTPCQLRDFVCHDHAGGQIRTLSQRAAEFSHFGVLGAVISWLR